MARKTTIFCYQQQSDIEAMLAYLDQKRPYSGETKTLKLSLGEETTLREALRLLDNQLRKTIRQNSAFKRRLLANV